MKIIRTYMDNFLNNYCHLIICEKTHEAIILDPLDVDKCMASAERHGANITKIINTHEHFDHIEGNPGVVEATGAKIHAHENAADSIPNVDVALKAGDVVSVGEEVKLRVLYTPGHTNAHLCLFSEGKDDTGGALFCGDTLFNASSGNCRNGGNINDLYTTFVNQLYALPDDTLIYPGHDYIVTNLKYALSREPGNKTARQLLEEVEKQSPDTRTVTSLGLERQMNPFFRLDSPVIIETLQNENHLTGCKQKDVFVSLRQLRDTW